MPRKYEVVRAKLALRLIGWARTLLSMPATANEDFDTCVYCGARGCEDGTAKHAPDCPSLTGVHVVTLRDMWPGGPALCGCGAVLWPGERYSHIKPDTHIWEVACLGCVARHELLEEP